MAHRHLILAYAVTWGIQLAYGAYLGLKWRSIRKAEQQSPVYRTDPS